MTWKTLMEVLAFEFRRLRSVPVVNLGFSTRPVHDPKELQDEELQCTDRIDMLVRDYARTRRWPALDERDRYFLRERIRFAYDYASLANFTVKRPLAIAGRPHLLNEQRRLIEWVLIDVWRDAGVVNWLEPFFLLADSTPPEQPKWDVQLVE